MFFRGKNKPINIIKLCKRVFYETLTGSFLYFDKASQTVIKNYCFENGSESYLVSKKFSNQDPQIATEVKMLTDV